jgi:hypothetical protein
MVKGQTCHDKEMVMADWQNDKTIACQMLRDKRGKGLLQIEFA